MSRAEILPNGLGVGEIQTSIRIVAQMDELFTIDAQARQKDLSLTDRHLLRLEKAEPLLDQINSGIQAARAGALPQSALAKACNYTLTLWTRLGRFLEYPDDTFGIIRPNSFGDIWHTCALIASVLLGRAPFAEATYAK